MIAGVVAEKKTVAAACWGRSRPMRFCCRPFELPQQCFDIHLTPREGNAKGKRSSTSMETVKTKKKKNQANEGKRKKRG